MVNVAIIGGVAGGFVLFLIIVILFVVICCMKWAKRNKHKKEFYGVDNVQSNKKSDTTVYSNIGYDDTCGSVLDANTINLHTMNMNSAFIVDNPLLQLERIFTESSEG